VIQVDHGGANAIVIAGGANRRITEADVSRALDGVTGEDWLLLQNEINDLEYVLARAAELDVRVALNVAPADGREAGYDLSGVDLVIVNETEAAALAGDTGLPPDTALERLAMRWPTCTVVLTLGRAGLVYRLPGDPPRRMAAYPVRAVDETAAGDAFIGYTLAGLLAGELLQPALRRGCAAGALAVTREGAATAIPLADEVRALVMGSSVR
jgi:ribokinase